jgi:hypothetical protein
MMNLANRAGRAGMSLNHLAISQMKKLSRVKMKRSVLNRVSQLVHGGAWI